MQRLGSKQREELLIKMKFDADKIMSSEKKFRLKLIKKDSKLF